MKKILFVCHGRICRSPMAEFIFKDMARREGLGAEFEVQSAATSREEIGNDIYPPAKRVLAVHGVPYEFRQSHQVKTYAMEHYDLIVIMDDNNARNLRRMFGNKYDAKIRKLMSFAETEGSSAPDVSDPWYTDDFETAYRDIEAGCKGLLAELTK